MKIESTAFEHNGEIPLKYTCDGQDVSPPLRFFDIPQNAESLVLIVDDPDSPSGDFVHWLTWNIEPLYLAFEEGTIPPGVKQGINGFGNIGYGGPCPSLGKHRYFFRLIALDNILDIDNGSTRQEMEAAMQGHVLVSAELVGTFERQK